MAESEFQFKEIVHGSHTFLPLYSQQFLANRVKAIADEISAQYKDKKPVFIGVLNGAFMFLSKLVRQLSILNFEIQFTKVSSYDGKETTELVKQLIGLKSSIQGKDVILVDDIVETGVTMDYIIKWVESQKPQSIQVCVAIIKLPKLQRIFKIDYCCFKLNQDLFLIGFGMDLNEFGRNLKDIYILNEDYLKLGEKQKEELYQELK